MKLKYDIFNNHTHRHSDFRGVILSARIGIVTAINEIRLSNTHNSPEQDVQTNEPMVTFTYVGPLWWQSKQYLLAGNDNCSRSTLKLYSSSFLMPLAISVVEMWLPEETCCRIHEINCDVVSRGDTAAVDDFFPFFIKKRFRSKRPDYHHCAVWRRGAKPKTKLNKRGTRINK